MRALARAGLGADGLSVTSRLAQDDGAEISAGTYTVTVLLNGAAIARASLAVLP